MTPAEIRSVLDKHAQWLRGEAGGVRANLYGADLGGADLGGADLYGADLYGADLRGADLGGADLYGADLRGANLYGADLRGANLYGADLGGADLRWADLREADLCEADLRGAQMPAPTMTLLAHWGSLSDATTLALMRLDASAHPDPSAFDRWAADPDTCPYDDVRVQRVANFQERAALWSPGPPPTIWEAMCMVLDEACPGWEDEAEGGGE